MSLLRFTILVAGTSLLFQRARASRQFVEPPEDYVLVDEGIYWKQHEGEKNQQRLLQAVQARKPLPIIEIVAQTDLLQDLESYLVAARLANFITGDGPYSFFPPWNEAWELLGDTMINNFRHSSRQWVGHLRNLLLYHLYMGEVNVADGSFVDLEMANGEEARVRRDSQGRLYFNDIPSISTYNATDGVAYMTDRVAMPAWHGRSIDDFVTDAENPTLVRLLSAAGLYGDMGNEDATYTLFAPTEQAILGLGDDFVEYLESPSNVNALVSIMGLHVVETILPSMNILPGNDFKVQSSSGQRLAIDKADSPVVLKVDPDDKDNAAIVVNADLFANNGVVHEIDTVLWTKPFPLSITDRLSYRPQFSILAEAIEKTDFASVLNDGNGPYLMFAPTDNAFGEELDSTLRGFVLSDPNWIFHLQDLLRFHVTTKVLTTDKMKDVEVFDMLNGEQVWVISNGSQLTPSFGFPNQMGAEVDLLVTEGLLTTISRPLAPLWASQSLLTVAEVHASQFGLFLEQTELAESAQASAVNWMIFAFSNDAYEALEDSVKDSLENDDGLLTSTLQNHIVEGIAPTNLIPVGESSVTSLFGNEMTVTKQGSQIRVEGNMIISGDMLAYNGILHMIDGVLLTGPIATDETSAPTPSPVAFQVLNGIDDEIRRTRILSTFRDYLDSAGILDELGQTGPFVVFAPTNTVFSSGESPADLQKYSQEPYKAHLISLMYYHIFRGRLPEEDGPITMRNGDTAELSTTAENEGRINGLMIIPGPFSADNGQLRLIPKVLSPPFVTRGLGTVAVSEYSRFTRLLANPSLESFATETLAAADAALTLFAPTDEAIADLGDLFDTIFGDDILAEEFVKYHFITAVIPSMHIATGSSTDYTTLTGDTVMVARNTESITINGIRVVTTDSLAFNGIIHGLDAALIPPSLAAMGVTTSNRESHVVAMALENAASGFKLNTWNVACIVALVPLLMSLFI